jgi:hypothetical protein
LYVQKTVQLEIHETSFKQVFWFVSGGARLVGQRNMAFIWEGLKIPGLLPQSDIGTYLSDDQVCATLG